MLKDLLLPDTIDSLYFNQLTTDIINNLLDELKSLNINFSDFEPDVVYGELSLNLTPPDSSTSCTILICNTSIHIIPNKNFGSDRADFILLIDDNRTYQEWSLIAKAFILDAIWFHKNEFYFEIFDKDKNLLDDGFHTTNLCHVLFKTQHLHTIKNIEFDSIHKVVISVDNELGENREFSFNIRENFFALCDRNLNNDDIILALTYLHTKYPETTYSIRQNLKLGLEL